MPLPAHLFASDDGHLYDTRDPDWSKRPPLRSRYKQHFGRGAPLNLGDIKAALRAGPYAWPGNYQLFFLTVDGDALAFETVTANFREVAQAWLDEDRTIWRIVGLEINYEDGDLYCAHSGKKIPASYVSDED